MDKIEILLEKLNNRIPASMAKRLDALDALDSKLELASQDYQKDQSDENRIKYNEIMDFVEETELKIVEDLEELLEKREASKKEKEDTPAPAPDPETTPTPDPIPAEVVVEKEEKSGMSIFGIALGVVLLVGTAGAYNYFNRNR
jgi:hypothetical protein